MPIRGRRKIQWCYPFLKLLLFLIAMILIKYWGYFCWKQFCIVILKHFWEKYSEYVISSRITVKQAAEAGPQEICVTSSDVNDCAPLLPPHSNDLIYRERMIERRKVSLTEGLLLKCPSQIKRHLRCWEYILNLNSTHHLLYSSEMKTLIHFS